MKSRKYDRVVGEITVSRRQDLLLVVSYLGRYLLIYDGDYECCMKSSGPVDKS